MKNLECGNCQNENAQCEYCIRDEENKNNPDFDGEDFYFNNSTKIKDIGEVDVEILDDSIDEDERTTSLQKYECMSCHWIFYGDVIKYGYGYTEQSSDCPKYCPMCGKEIADEIVVDEEK